MAIKVFIQNEAGSNRKHYHDEKTLVWNRSAEASEMARYGVSPRCSEDAEIPFDNILDRVTGCEPSVTVYVMEGPAKCPRCFWEIKEKTLIEPVE